MRTTRIIRGTVLVFYLFTLFSPALVRAQSAPSKPVVINEVAWAGTSASGNDEWIELYNNTSTDIDLTGWTINDDNGSQINTIASGVIAAHSYFLIEDSELSTSVPADALSNMSLANSGDSLALTDAQGQVIDLLNASGGAWYAGSSTTHATMELMHAETSSDLAEEWGTNSGSSGVLDRNGDVVAGTPRGENSASQAPQVEARVALISDTASPRTGEIITITARVEEAASLFSYGLDVSYDPEVLEYVTVTNGGFLSNEGEVGTSFQAGLSNGTPGMVVIAESRLYPETRGQSGSGALFNLSFRVIGEAGTTSEIRASSDGSSFVSGVNSDQPVAFSAATVAIRMVIANPVQSLTGTLGAERYEIALSWQAPSTGADTYRVMRRDQEGVFTEIGSTHELSFTDGDTVSGAGQLVPHVAYDYQVIALHEGAESSAIEVQIMETRGIKGDNNRSDRVDGRDLQRLAQQFTQTRIAPTFDPRVDTTYDGRIDGSDLIDLAANWALTYTP